MIWTRMYRQERSADTTGARWHTKVMNFIARKAERRLSVRTTRSR